MAATDTKNTTFDELYYEAARSYAVSKGANIDPRYPDVISAKVLIEGAVYFAMFLRAASGGTIVRLEEARRAEARLFEQDEVFQKIMTDIANAGPDSYSRPYGT